ASMKRSIHGRQIYEHRSAEVEGARRLVDNAVLLPRVQRDAVKSGPVVVLVYLELFDPLKSIEMEPLPGYVVMALHQPGNHLSTGQVTQITHVVVRQNHFGTVFLAKGPRVCDGGRANRYCAVCQLHLEIGADQGGQVPLDTRRAIQSPIIDGGEQPVVEVVLMQHVLKRLIDDVLLHRQRRKRRKARLSPQKFG